MNATLGLHVAAGFVALGAGFVALYTKKGAFVHRKSGLAFVYAMLTMSVLGMWIAVTRDRAPSINLPAGLMTSYLVLTALVTVHRPASWSTRADVMMMGVILAVGLFDAWLAAGAVARAGRFVVIPTVPFAIFAIVCTLAARGDYRVITEGTATGHRRLARHLWRMCVAMLVAALSFTVQLPKILPAGVKVPPAAIALPILSVAAIMFYYLWNHRGRRHVMPLAGVEPRHQLQ